jgi:gamma-glutamylcyclotransferase (GGCT)/AIG2-like uncharacterized protein YtfP
MLYFAYGSNMSPALMGRHCPAAAALGTARLAGWRFMIMRNGYASIVPAQAAQVHGVLWRLSPRDLAALDAYESVDSGLYRRRMLAVAHRGRRVSALVYLGRERAEGRPTPAYQRIVVAAAREWDLPAAYIRGLERWGPPGARASRAIGTGAFA